MIKNSDEFSRRILKSPAIRPSETVNPTALLSSLKNVAHSISLYSTKSFFTNKQNSKKSIRLVKNLIFFLQEIKQHSNLSDSIVLCLSELYFIFQKIEFLLEDLAQDNAHVFMLMKYEQVSNRLCFLMRSIGVALDVLQWDSVDVSFEVKELVELVRRQALRSKFELENDDKMAFNKVTFILSCFANGIVPNSSDLGWVVEYLGIKSWSQCTKEVKFLDDEIGLENLTCEKKDLELLTSLMALMTYLRCVCFDFADSCSSTRECGGAYGKNEVISCLNSDDLRCPISLELMFDPVTISTGHTYDRSSIEKWFKAGNATCPKTGEKLICTSEVPNLVIKHLVRQYCFETGIPFGEKVVKSRDIKNKENVAGSLATEGAMKMVAKFLVERLENGCGEEKNKAAYEIRLLTKTSIFNRSSLVDAGVIPNLLNLLCSKDSARQENASAALLNLSKYSESKRVLVENGGLELVLDVLQKGLKMEARQHAAGTLFYLASVEEYRIMIGEIPWALSALMELIVEGTDRAKKNALVTILGLLMYPDNHWKVLSAGVVPLLVNLLGSLQREDLLIDCLAVLATLAEKHDGAMVILRAKALPMIVEVFGHSTTRPVRENCVSLLLALCTNGGADVVQVLVKNQSLMEPLYSVLADGSCRAGRKAGSLIRILHEFNEKSSSGLMTPAIPRERFIHVW